MSQERPMQSPALASHQQPAIAQIRRAPVLNLIGLPELIGLAGAALLALITLFAYFYFYLPAQSRLNSAQTERDRLQAIKPGTESPPSFPFLAGQPPEVADDMRRAWAERGGLG